MLPSEACRRIDATGQAWLIQTIDFPGYLPSNWDARAVLQPPNIEQIVERRYRDGTARTRLVARSRLIFSEFDAVTAE
jgi:hypothetical protein